MRNFSNSVAIKAKMGKRTGNLPSGSSTFEELHQKPGISAQETPRSPERKETQMGFSWISAPLIFKPLKEMGRMRNARETEEES